MYLEKKISNKEVILKIIELSFFDVYVIELADVHDVFAKEHVKLKPY